MHLATLGAKPIKFCWWQNSEYEHKLANIIRDSKLEGFLEKMNEKEIRNPTYDDIWSE